MKKMHMEASRADVARKAGVSGPTVSRALSDSPLIPASTRERVKAVADKLHDDPPTAEAAFALAAAIAFADDEIADEENELLNEFADALGLEAEVAEKLLDELHIGPPAE